MPPSAAHSGGIVTVPSDVTRVQPSTELRLGPPGITLPMIYRFRPADDDVDSCWFDLMFLRPLKEGETHPEPPQCVNLDVFETYATVPNMNPGLAIVYEQDTSNMAAQQKGFKAGKKRGETLANFQEARTRQVHITLDKYLNA